MNRKYIRASLVTGVLALGLILSFQNCAPSFKSSIQTEASSLNDPFTEEEMPTTTTTTTTTLPPPQLKETRFFLGSPAGITAIKLNHISGDVSFVSTTPFAGQNVGWLNYESSNRKIVALDAGSGRLQTNLYDPATGQIGLADAYVFKSGVVHTSIVPATNKFYLYTSSYDRGELDSSVLSATLTDVQSVGPSLFYGSQAKTHSSAYDAKRKLLYVANLGLNRISIYRVDLGSGGLVLLGQVLGIVNPRTLLYHEGFDKLYLVTEAYSGSSEIQAFSIIDNQSSVSLQSEGVQTMPLSGADIKIDSVHRYALATVREAGKEAIVAMPLTTAGKKDSTRNSFQISLDRPKPRSLEISADGKYVLVAMDSEQSNNIQVFKLNYSAENVFVSSERVFQHSLSGGGILSSLSIPFIE